MRHIHLLVFSFLFIISCSKEKYSGLNELSISTDKNIYQIEDTVLLTITNVWDTNISFFICDGEIILNLDKYNESWETISNQSPCTGFGSYCCKDLAPNEKWQFTFPTSDMVTGQYRFWIQGFQLGSEAQYSETPIYSNDFELK